MSSPEKNKVNLMRFYEEVINQGNLDAVDELMAPDFVHHGETLFPQIIGSQPIKMGVGGVRAAYPDGHTIVEDMVAEGDTVVCRLSWSGTHKGTPFMGVPRERGAFDVARHLDLSFQRRRKDHRALGEHGRDEPAAGYGPRAQVRDGRRRGLNSLAVPVSGRYRRAQDHDPIGFHRDLIVLAPQLFPKET